MALHLGMESGEISPIHISTSPPAATEDVSFFFKHLKCQYLHAKQLRMVPLRV